MSFFPINIDLRNRKILLIGGGKVAERKISILLNYTDSITIIAPRITRKLKELNQLGKITHIHRSFKKGDLQGFQLVFSTTNDVTTTQKIHQEALEHNILLNAADIPDYCDFFLPAIVKRGDLSLAISTSGKCPALAKHIKDQLEKIFTDEYGPLTALLGNIRKRTIRTKKKNINLKEILGTLLLETENIKNWIKSNNYTRIEKLINQIFDYKLDVKKVIKHE